MKKQGRCEHFKGLGVAWENEGRIYIDPLDGKQEKECPFCSTHNRVLTLIGKKKKYWCEHNLWRDDGWVYDQTHEPIEDEAMFCDICGAKRP